MIRLDVCRTNYVDTEVPLPRMTHGGLLDQVHRRSDDSRMPWVLTRSWMGSESPIDSIALHFFQLFLRSSYTRFDPSGRLIPRSYRGCRCRMLGSGWLGKLRLYDPVTFPYSLFSCWVLNFRLDFAETKINRSRISRTVDGVENNAASRYDLSRPTMA